MFASPEAINRLSYPETIMMSFEYLLSLATISDVLRERRGDLEGTPEYLSGTAMSKALRLKFQKKRARSQAWISLLETGADSADLLTLQPEVRLELLRLYAFTDDEIGALSEKFDLELDRELAPDVENFTPQPLRDTGTLEFAIRSLGTPHEGGSTLLTQAFLGSHRADDCFTLAAGGSLLACEEIKRELKRGYTLYFDAAQEPVVGKPVAYQVVGSNRYLVTLFEHTLTPRWVTSYDGTDALFIKPGDPPLELLGAYWRFIPPERWPDEKTVNAS